MVLAWWLSQTVCCDQQQTLQKERMSSAAWGQPLRRVISNRARQMRGALEATYMRSATRLKLSTLAFAT